MTINNDSQSTHSEYGAIKENINTSTPIDSVMSNVGIGYQKSSSKKGKREDKKVYKKQIKSAKEMIEKSGLLYVDSKDSISIQLVQDLYELFGGELPKTRLDKLRKKKMKESERSVTL